MITISNSLSFFRAPLALLFLLDNPTLRLTAILFAALTDSIDGYIARRYKSTSRFGAILDPAMDKFFVYFALAIFCREGHLVLWEAIALIARDFFVCVYGVVMISCGKRKSIIFRSVKWGKITTALQFIVLAGLVHGFSFSWVIFSGFVGMGFFALLELFQPPVGTVQEAKQY